MTLSSVHSCRFRKFGVKGWDWYGREVGKATFVDASPTVSVHLCPWLPQTLRCAKLCCGDMYIQWERVCVCVCVWIILTGSFLERTKYLFLQLCSTDKGNTAFVNNLQNTQFFHVWWVFVKISRRNNSQRNGSRKRCPSIEQWCWVDTGTDKDNRNTFSISSADEHDRFPTDFPTAPKA